MTQCHLVADVANAALAATSAVKQLSFGAAKVMPSFQMELPCVAVVFPSISKPSRHALDCSARLPIIAIDRLVGATG